MSLSDSLLENAVQKVLDDSLRENSSNASGAGLEVRVTRTYDGKGLSGGRECHWCLDRCGENMTLNEAYNKGAFQRHPGCGCEILYSVGKRTLRQTNWEHNEWTDVDKEKLINDAKNLQNEETLTSSERLAILDVAQSPGDAIQPLEYKNDFSDYKELDISEETRKALAELKDLSETTDWEYGRSLCDGEWLDYYTDMDHDKVNIPYLTKAKHVELYHAHTDESPPSPKDLESFTKHNIDRIAVTSANGDVWVVDIGYGIRPTEAEFDKINDLCYNQAQENLKNDPQFSKWSYDEKSYMLVRERMRLVTNYFEWNVMGGPL